ncbi:MAG: hypothetical protein U0930_24700 [Pirellulales bacterium]
MSNQPNTKSEGVKERQTLLSSKWYEWFWLLVGLTALKLTWSMTSEASRNLVLPRVSDIREQTLYSPLDMAYLATINWLLWTKPASVRRRAILALVELGIGWWYVKEVGQLPIVVLGYGSLLLTQTLIAQVIKLPGWRDDLRLIEASEVVTTISIREIQLITAAIAVLCYLAVKNSSTEVIEALTVTIGFGVTAALIQKAFLAARYNLLWTLLAMVNSLFVIGVITTMRIIERQESITPQLPMLVMGQGLDNWTAGIEIIASTTVFVVVVSAVPALVAWSLVQQRIAKNHNATLEKALAEAKALMAKEPTT